MKIDLEKFRGTLPYGSELYGIYQPLLGWKSRLMTRRVEAGLNSFRRRFLTELFPRFRPQTEVVPETLHPRDVRFRIGLATEAAPSSPLLDAGDSIVARRVLEEVRRAGFDNSDAWRRTTRPGSLTEMLNRIEDDVRTEYAGQLAVARRALDGEVADAEQRRLLNGILARESVAAGALSFLHSQGNGQQIMALTMPATSLLTVRDRLLAFEGLRAMIDPRKSQLASAVISPIGIVHLFRQYFFEFDTFLGPAVEHLWLSPGGTVELAEVSTRKAIVERLAETAFEWIQTTEKFLMLEDELSDAMRKLNASNTKFGVSLHTSNSFSAGSIFTSQLNAGSTFDFTKNEEEAREQIHKGTRQQSERVATELKRSIKTTFKVVTETTDIRSRRYTIQNTTGALMNYELRRKMRQVGIQVQDYGTHLCWQTYVDKPGDELGLANLVHIAVPGDMPPLQQPELPPDPVPYRGPTIKYTFHWPLDDPTEIGIHTGDRYLPYVRDVVAGNFPAAPAPGFVLEKVDISIVAGPQWGLLWRPIGPQQPVAPGMAEMTATEFQLYHPPKAGDENRQPYTDEPPDWTFELTPVFVPSEWLRGEVRKAKEAKIKEATQKQEREYKEKLFTAVKERVKLASHVQLRRFEDLREEERIIVYRNLIRQLMSDTGVDAADARVRHVFAELVQSMFDVEKMLYFVAPEWWTPRRLENQQAFFLPEVNQAEFRKYSTVSWGGARADRQDNYYITDDSAPAKLGSSLGWVIQLDGDNLRNAFLNAPWVKAVIPIREGRERQAMEWLSSSNVEGSDGLDGVYQPGDPDELQRIRHTLGLPDTHTVAIKDAIHYLIARIQQKQDAALTKERDQNGAELGYLPPDKVYEHGFDPLANGFRAQGAKAFEIFDQWIEVVPTDQIVPVEVEYDPKTGMQR